MIALQFENIKTVRDLNDTIDYVQAELDKLTDDNYARLMANDNLSYLEIQQRAEIMQRLNEFNQLQRIDITKMTDYSGEYDGDE